MRKKLLISVITLTAALLGLASCGTDNYSKTTKKSAAAVVERTI